MAPKLTSCDVFGMLLKYLLSTESGFLIGDRVNPVGVLVSGGLLCSLVSGIVAVWFAPRHSVINRTCSFNVPCKVADFLCNQDVCARTMGCKRALSCVFDMLLHSQKIS